jgi:hypothetical protein
MTPGAGTYDNLSNVILRGWKVVWKMEHENAKLLRVHLETSQGTEKTSSFLWKYGHDSSSEALISFMVFGDLDTSDLDKKNAPNKKGRLVDNVLTSSWAMAYYPLQNWADATNIDGLKILEPDMYNPVWTEVGRPRGSVTGLTLSSSSAVGGDTLTGTVQLSAPAGPKGQIVSIMASNNDVWVPETVTVNAGDSTASFTIITRGVVETKKVTIRVAPSKKGSFTSQDLILKPWPKS